MPSQTRAAAKKKPVKAPAPDAANLPIDSSLFFKLVRLVNLTARPFVENLSRSHALSLNEWRTMVVLASHPGVAAREVADYTGLDKMSVSRAIAALGQHRRITKTPDPSDARRVQLRLNAAGRKLFETIGQRAGAREAQLFSGLSESEHTRLAQAVDKLTAAIEAAEATEAT
jgi:DNA-binding MarR family transcriptional regulator